tara:strand:- start:2183 stop:2410 length:228 start_codon:yes stop_codon:yes gene_type:complete
MVKTRILNQKILAHVYLVDIKFEHEGKEYRVSCDYYSDTGVENIDVYQNNVWLSPYLEKDIYIVATDLIYEIEVK